MGLAQGKLEEYQSMVGTRIGHRTLLYLMEPEVTKNNNPGKNRYFWSRCDCGTEARVLAPEIAKGKRTHCGCRNDKILIDLTGQRFGHWTVLSRADNKMVPATGKQPHGIFRPLTMWNCRCDCGKEKVNYGGNLRSGRTKQCSKCNGRAAKQRLQKVWVDHPWDTKGRWKYNDGGLTARFNSVRYGAIKRNKFWNISLELYKELVVQDCFYCHRAPHQISHGKQALPVNGLDRWINNQGYCDHNVVPCCGSCNHLKGKMDGDDFLKEIFTISKNNS